MGKLADRRKENHRHQEEMLKMRLQYKEQVSDNKVSKTDDRQLQSMVSDMTGTKAAMMSSGMGAVSSLGDAAASVFNGGKFAKGGGGGGCQGMAVVLLVGLTVSFSAFGVFCYEVVKIFA